jgi:hypothetical protein
MLIGRRFQLMVAVCSALAIGGIASGLVLVFGETSSAAPTRSDYLVRIDEICQDYGRRLDRVTPPVDIGVPGEIVASLEVALPLLQEQTDRARAVRVPKVLQARVKRFFELSDRYLAGLAEALHGARVRDYGGIGHGYLQAMQARDAAQVEAKTIGFHC